MEEQRRFVRLETRVDVAYTVLPSGTSQRTVTKDLSGGGVRFFTETPLAPGTQLQMALALPGREQPVNALAQVVWSEQHELVGKADRQRSAENGAKFVEIAPADQEALTQFISSRLKIGDGR